MGENHEFENRIAQFGTNVMFLKLFYNQNFTIFIFIFFWQIIASRVVLSCYFFFFFKYSLILHYVKTYTWTTFTNRSLHENSHSVMNVSRKLCSTYRQHNRPTVRTIRNFIIYFENHNLLLDNIQPNRLRPACSEKLNSWFGTVHSKLDWHVERRGLYENV